ncbi:LCP family protein [Clostridium hydrogeniformans]|uniref:LCP family protein n=1 Tax=Clostridium hydrogeniformans TaxID=349933 RepID=UPI0004868ADD|nr:LCP family protein [Clostridium hydrogeniformans]
MKKGIKRGILIIVGILVLTGGLLGYKVYSKYSKIKTNEITLSDEELKVSNDIDNSSKEEILNFIILAVDKYENATDAIMVATIDKKHDELKLTSISRDLYVDTGEGNTPKLNYAYHYGGAVNTIKIVNENLGLDIRDYILLNFESVVEIIDTIGGIDLDLTYEEIHGSYALNERAKNLSKLINKEMPKPLDKEGVNHLNGIQAAGYARVRVIDDDFKRTNRQRKIINEIMKKTKKMNISELDKFTDVVFKNIETSFNFNKLINLSKEGLELYNKPIKDTNIPIKDTFEGHYWDNGAFYFTWDKGRNKEYIKKFIYEDRGK